MREVASSENIKRFMDALGVEADTDTRVHFEPHLYRYPALDPASFRRAVAEVFGAR